MNWNTSKVSTSRVEAPGVLRIPISFTRRAVLNEARPHSPRRAMATASTRRRRTGARCLSGSKKSAIGSSAVLATSGLSGATLRQAAFSRSIISARGTPR